MWKMRNKRGKGRTTGPQKTGEKNKKKKVKKYRTKM